MWKQYEEMKGNPQNPLLNVKKNAKFSYLMNIILDKNQIGKACRSLNSDRNRGPSAVP